MLQIKVNKDILLVKIRMKSASIIFKKVEKSRKYLEEWLPWMFGIKDLDIDPKFTPSSFFDHVMEAKKGVFELIPGKFVEKQI